MAIGISYLKGTAVTTNAASYALGTCTPSANALLVLMGFVSTTVTAPGSVTGWGLTWNNGTTFTFNGGADSAYLFYAPAGASPGNGTATLFVTGDNGAGAAVMLWEVTGADVSNPIRQLKTALGTTANPTLTLGTAPLATSGLIGGYGMNRGTPSGTAPTGWDATDMSAGYTTPSAGGVGGHDASPAAGTVITFTSPTSGTVGVIVLEVNVAATVATGSLDVTLADATIVSDGTVAWGPITGILDKTLADATLISAAQTIASGNLDKTLATATLSATANAIASGALDKILAAATLSATGTVANAGSNGELNITLANATLDAQAEMPIAGNLSKTLADATLNASGEVSWGAPISGELNVTLAGASLSSDGQSIIQGELVQTLANATLLGAGAIPAYGLLTKTLADATLISVGGGVTVSTGTLNITLENAIVISAGVIIAGQLKKYNRHTMRYHEVIAGSKAIVYRKRHYGRY